MQVKCLRFALHSVLIAACLCCSTNRLEQLQTEIFALHDEVMPFLPQMKKQRQELRRFYVRSEPDSIDARHASIALHRADSQMWAWMYQYVPIEQLQDTMAQEEIEIYLKDQRRLAARVNTSIKKAMAEAEKLLSEQ